MCYHNLKTIEFVFPARKAKRKEDATKSLSKIPPSEEERNMIHGMFIESMDKYVKLTSWCFLVLISISNVHHAISWHISRTKATCHGYNVDR